MSVFTPVSDAEARALLEHYALGELERLEGIAQGVENTNYFLTTTTGEYVLTLFEHIPRADLPFYVGLMDHLAHRDVICPQPMRRENGEMLAEVNGKPACIVTRLPGAPRAQPDAGDCRAVGEILAHIHVASRRLRRGTRELARAGMARELRRDARAQALRARTTSSSPPRTATRPCTTIRCCPRA